MSENGEEQRFDRTDLLKVGAAGAVVLAGARSPLAFAQTPRPRRGGVARVGVVPDINLAGSFQNQNANFCWWRLVFNTLTELDHRTLQPRPALATSWQFSEAGRVLTLRLRNDVRFHNGRRFGPRDVVAIVEAAKVPPWRHQFGVIIDSISDASVVGSNIVRLRLSNSLSNLFDLLELLPMVAPESLGGLASGASVVGTGPFIFREWRRGESVTLTRNARYWKPGLPYLNGVTIRVIPQEQALVASLSSRQSDLIMDVSPAGLVPLRGVRDIAVARSDVRGASIIMGVNTKIPPFDKKDVRQAVAWSIDRERVRKQVMYDTGVVTSVPWAQSSPAWTRAGANHYSYNLPRARTLLSRAGASGANVTIALPTDIPVPRAASQILQFNLEELGLDTNVVSYDTASFISALVNQRMPGVFVSVQGLGHLSPATLINGGVFTRPTGNASVYTSDAYTALGRTALVARTKAQQTRVYARLTQLLLDETFTSNIVSYPRVWVSQTRLRNYYYNINDFLNLDQAFLRT